MAAVDYCVGHMIYAEIEYAGDQAVSQTYVPKRFLLDAIPVEDLKAYIADRGRAGA